MQTTKDELKSERHLNMTFIEFLEALARVADKFQMQWIKDHCPDYESRHPHLLDKKLEYTILECIKGVLGPRTFNQVLEKYKKDIDIENENLEKGIYINFQKKPEPPKEEKKEDDLL